MTTCKQCREFEKCKDDAFINGAKFDPNESVKYCTGFEPITNADRIRAMSDSELAHFMTERSVNESTLLLINENHGLTAVQIKAIKHNIYCACMQWLKQPVGGDGGG